ncbi:hypothetical protein [Labilithrix luteola]|nr:hypothetical protein [Labilithrix luteola]
MKLKTISLLAMAGFAAACGSDGEQGPPGPAGTSTTGSEQGSASVVSPNKAVLDRELDVQLGFSGSNFTDATKPTIDFGPGITVGDVKVSSPTLLIAHVTIAKDAPIGPKTIKVGNIEATDAFTVVPAIEVKVGDKSGASGDQGSLAQFVIENNDSKAFDTAQGGFGLVDTDFLDLGSSATGPVAGTGLFLVPPLAPAGKKQLTFANLDAQGKPRLSFLSSAEAFEVVAHTPTALANDTPKDEVFGDVYDSKLYKLSAAGAAIVDYRVEVAGNQGTLPYTFVFGTGGKASDLITRNGPPSSLFGTAPPPYDLHAILPVVGAGDYYFVTADLSGSANQKMKVTGTVVNATVTPEPAAAHDQTAPFTVATLPATDGLIVTGELNGEDEFDAYKITGAPGDKIQIAVTATKDREIEVVLTKDPTVIAEADGTPDPDRKVLGYVWAPNYGTNATITLSGQTDLFVVIHKDPETKGSALGKYVFSARKVQ